LFSDFLPCQVGRNPNAESNDGTNGEVFGSLGMIGASHEGGFACQVRLDQWIRAVIAHQTGNKQAAGSLDFAR
jgi:hypothetical protein